MKNTTSLLLGLIAAGSLALSGPARGQALVYAAEFSQPTNRFGTIDLLNGAFTKLSSLGSSTINDIAYCPTNGAVYAISNSTSLITLNKTNGNIMSSVNLSVSGLQSLAFRPSDGALFAATQRRLYALNPANGNATLIGSYGTPTNLNNAGQNIRFAQDGNLYVSNTSTNTDIYRINLTNGVATSVGQATGYAYMILQNGGQYMYAVYFTLNSATNGSPRLATFDLSSFVTGGTNANGSTHQVTVLTVGAGTNFPSNFSFSGNLTQYITNLTVIVGATSLTNQSASVGSNATFSTVASGTGPYSYSWLKNGSLLSGRTNSSLTLSNVTFADAATYSVIVNGSLGSVTNSATLTVTKLNQTITFNSIATQTYGSSAFTLSASASSGLPVTFSVASGPATISSNTLTLTGAGSVTVNADQAGNTNYNAAPTASQSFTVNTATLTVSGITANNKVYDGTTAASLNPGGAALAGVIGGDAVTLNTGGAVGTFASRTAGSGKTVFVSGLTLSGAKATNYSLTQPTATANISAKGLTVSGVTAGSKVYDGNTTATINTGGAALTGVVGGDTVTLDTGSVTGAFANKAVGTGKTVTVSGLSLGGADASNYSLTQPAPTADITAKGLTIPGVTANNKVYDGTTAATLNTGSAALVGVVSGDTVALNAGSAAGVFADKNVGIGKTVAVGGFTVSGADAGNYSLTQPSATADITAKGLTVSGVTADSKVYDGNTTATLNTGSAALVGVAGGDTVTLNTGSVAGAFANKAVGTGKTVTVSGLSLSGADAANYSLTQPAASADITARTLTVSATAANKVYDGTVAAVAALSDNRLAGDSLTTGYTSAAFVDRNVGTGKTVNVTGISVTGADAGNYSFNTSAATTANITVATVAGSVTANNKVYDGTAAATIATRSLSGAVVDDAVSLSGGSASFSDKNVGNGKTVTATGLGLSGADAGNYSLASATATTTADITARALTVTAAAANKVYDGTVAASVALSDDRVGGDSLVISAASAGFADKNIGTGKTVTVSGITVTGSDAGNYTFNSTATTTADITAATATGSVTASNKVYDGTATAMIATRSLSGAAVGDAVSLTGGSAAFSDKNVGNGKTVTATGLSLSGVDAGNYTLASSTVTTTADISGRALAVSATAANKVYDGTTTASVTLSDNHLAGDAVSVSYTSADFADANVGTGKTVTVSGISVGGADGGNYAANASTTATANITAAMVTPSVTASDKVYDGNTAATLATRSLTGVMGADNVTLNCGPANFADAIVGTNKAVTATGLSLGGAQAANYALATTSASATASILAPPVAPEIVACTMLPNGSMSLNCSGTPGQSFTVQATVDLTSPNWQPVGAFTLDVAGLRTVVDTEAAQHAARFYRISVSYQY